MEEVSKKISGIVEVNPKKIEEAEKEITNVFEFKKRIEDCLNRSTTELLNTLLVGSLVLDSSDIHLEPEKDEIKMRIRIDGFLQDIGSFGLQTYEALLGRIKMISGLKLNINDRSQDGRFSIYITGEKLIEIRTSTLPTENGETIALRILNPESLISMRALGLETNLLELFEREIKRPNGMIIVTGPTGSGKTTTLYSFLTKIRKPSIKIITIEDPIEYHIEGISQTQVDPVKGYDFASGLKSIMRQDPDVILVGEIRDKQTCNTALQAALTGHLVFSTLHTNDATGTIARLINLEARPLNIGPAVNLIIAQRLIRKACKKCSKPEKISAKTLNYLKKELKTVPKDILPKIPEKILRESKTGCKECNNTGYKGRVGIYEAFLVDDEIEKAILANSATAALKNIAVKKGMITVHQHGLIKVINGVTTIEEVKRVTGE